MDVKKVKKSGKVSGIADLPPVLQYCPMFYSPDSYRNLFIPEEHRKNIAAVSSMGSDSRETIYIIHRTSQNAASQDRFRSIISSFQKSKTTSYLLVAESTNEALIESINSSFVRPNINKSHIQNNQKTESASEMATKILYAAMKANTSDLHIESDGKTALIRFRKYKELFTYDVITHEQAVLFGGVCFGTFVKGSGQGQERGTGDGVYHPTNILEGEFSRLIDDVNLKARMVNFGLNHGDSFNLIMRLIDKNKSNKAQRFEDLGFSKNSCLLLRELETLSKGLVLTIGVTNSGKSTSQQNMIQNEVQRSAGGRKVISIENPVEADVEGVTQINAGEKNAEKAHDYSFGNMNRIFMRSDPDSLIYGEIRDEETAQAALKGVLTGHLVYGTLHVAGVINAFSRFESLGVPIDVACRLGFLRVVLYQHLLPKLCPHCSIKYKIGQPPPPKYGEIFAVKTIMNAGSKKLHLKDIMEIQKSLSPSDSLLRELQKRSVISSSELVALRRRLNFMNSESDASSFSRRLDHLAHSSLMDPDKINIRFRGQGCEHCFQGAAGITPASEVLIPDEEFLSYVRDGKLSKAELYWKTTLRGRTATHDTYDKILTGVVDPRTVEEELERLGS